MISFTIDSVGAAGDVCAGDGPVGEGGRAMGGRVLVKWTVLEHAAKMRKRDPRAVDTHQIISLGTPGAGGAGLGSNSSRSWGTHDFLWMGE